MNKLDNFNKESGFKVSERYVPVNTQDIVNSFEAAGYQINKVKAAGVIDPAKQGYQKHMIRMSHPDTTLKIEGLTPEIILKNSFDGSSAFRLNIGVYRLICSNGLEVGTTFTSERVRHVGKDVLNQVLQAAERIKLGLPQLSNEIELMRNHQFSENEARHLAGLMGLNLVKHRSDVNRVYSDDLLRVRRSGDSGFDAFTVMNVIQENALNGRWSYVVDKSNGKLPKHVKGRAVRSIDKTSQVNQFLWDKTLDLIGA